MSVWSCLSRSSRQIDGFVGIELLEGLGDLLVRHLLEHLIAHAFVELGQRRGVEVVAQRGDERLALVRAQQLDQVGEVCFMQIERELAYGLGIAGLKSGFDGMQEVGAERPLLVAQSDLVCRVLHPALPIEVS